MDLCVKLERVFEYLEFLFPPDEGGKLCDAIVHVTFHELISIISVAKSQMLLMKEQNRDTLLKLLHLIKNRYSYLLKTSQLDELNKMVDFLYYEGIHNRDCAEMLSLNPFDSESMDQCPLIRTNPGAATRCNTSFPLPTHSEETQPQLHVTQNSTMQKFKQHSSGTIFHNTSLRNRFDTADYSTCGGLSCSSATEFYPHKVIPRKREQALQSGISTTGTLMVGCQLDAMQLGANLCRQPLSIGTAASSRPLSFQTSSSSPFDDQNRDSTCADCTESGLVRAELKRPRVGTFNSSKPLMKCGKVGWAENQMDVSFYDDEEVQAPESSHMDIIMAGDSAVGMNELQHSEQTHNSEPVHTTQTIGNYSEDNLDLQNQAVISQPKIVSAHPNFILKSLEGDTRVIRMKLRDPRRVLFKSTDHLPTVERPEDQVQFQESQGASACTKSNPWGDVNHLLDGCDDQEKATILNERARRIMEQREMFAARKLCLVLDLDHTLLNSVKFSEVSPINEELLRKKEEKDREKAQRHLFRLEHLGMWTKLRPGIWNFLQRASMLFELHLCTMGSKPYATEMAKILDPTGTLFVGRVISRGDDGHIFEGEELPKSKDLDGVLGMESAVLIIDDTPEVWPLHQGNLIVVERYLYFPGSRQQFHLFGPALLEVGRDERLDDGALASCLALIERIHERFFAHESLEGCDVRNLLKDERRKILAGCRIVFSRIFPIGKENPHLEEPWVTAEKLGAVCSNEVDESTTHVVAGARGTNKVQWALSTGRFVVSPQWIHASAVLHRRASEFDFQLKPERKTLQKDIPES